MHESEVTIIEEVGNNHFIDYTFYYESNFISYGIIYHICLIPFEISGQL